MVFAMKDFIRKVLSLPSRKDEGSVFAAIESDMQKEEKQTKEQQKFDKRYLLSKLKQELPLHLYGKEGFPSWHNLTDEILSNRCHLEIGSDDQIIRFLQICHVEFVSHKGEKLIETRQELLGGKIVKRRNRDGIYAKVFDDPTACLAGAIQSLGENVDCLLKRDSESYPDLLTRYDTWTKAEIKKMAYIAVDEAKVFAELDF